MPQSAGADILTIMAFYTETIAQRTNQCANYTNRKKGRMDPN